MNYFAHVDENNILQGWYNEEIHDTIPTPCIEVSQEQWQYAIDNGHNKINLDGTSEFIDTRTIEEKGSSERKIRNQILETKVDPIVSNPFRWDSLSESDQTEVIIYRQALLDLPQQESFPEDLVWPSVPTVLT